MSVWFDTKKQLPDFLEDEEGELTTVVFAWVGKKTMLAWWKEDHFEDLEGKEIKPTKWQYLCVPRDPG